MKPGARTIERSVSPPKMRPIRQVEPIPIQHDRGSTPKHTYRLREGPTATQPVKPEQQPTPPKVLKTLEYPKKVTIKDLRPPITEEPTVGRMPSNLTSPLEQHYRTEQFKPGERMPTDLTTHIGPAQHRTIQIKDANFTFGGK